MTAHIFLRRSAWVLAAGGLVLTGCPQKQRVEAAGREHCGTITTAETWAASGGAHHVTCDVLVDDAGVLTIEAGARVVFDEDTGIYVSHEGRGGSLRVQGTPESRVVMEAAPPPASDPPVPYAPRRGAWRGIVVSTGASDVRIAGLSMDGAGGRGTEAAIAIEDTSVLLDHVTITRSEGCGLMMDDPARLDDASTALEVHDAEWPACVTLLDADSLPATESDYTGNDSDRVRVAGGTLPTQVTWEDLGVPYEMRGALTVSGDAANPAMLTLESGTTVLFEIARSLSVYENGGLVTNGTSDRPVVLGPSVDEGPGSWMGVGISSGAPTSRLTLRGLVIENAGHVPVPTVPGSALYAAGASPLIDGVSLRGSSVLGFRFVAQAGFARGSRNLEVTDCDGVGILDAAMAHTVPEEGAQLTGNATDAVEVEHGSVTESVTWGDPGVPYLVRGSIYFDGTGASPAVLTVEPGTTIENTGGGLSFSAYQGAAGLVAVGTPDRPIVFTGRRAGVMEQEHWYGIGFGDDVIDSMCRLENVDIGFGGSNGWSATSLGLAGASPTLSAVHIHDSASYGLAIDRNSMPSMTNVTFARNTSGDIAYP